MLLDPFFRAAETQPDKLCLTVDSRSISYSKLRDHVCMVASGVSELVSSGGLLSGLRSGPRVALLLRNRIELLEAFLGTVAAGGVGMILDPKWPISTINRATAAAPPDLLIIEASMYHEVKRIFPSTFLLAVSDEDYTDKLVPETTWYRSWRDDHRAAGPPAPVNPDTPFLIGFTSGTSGTPKGYIRTQESWRKSFKASGIEFGVSSGDRVCAPGPLVFSLGLYALIEGLCCGAAGYTFRQFNVKTLLNVVQNSAITKLDIVPTMAHQMVDQAKADGDRLTNVRLITSSGAKLSPELKKKLAWTFPNAEIAEYYGASETSFITVTRSKEGAPSKSVGRAFHGIEIEVRRDNGTDARSGETGLLFLRSPYISSGYIQPTDGTGFRVIDGWATVGDNGWKDENDFVYIAGREKEMLNSGSYNIYPSEVEEALMMLPEVKEVVAFGLPDTYWGEIVCAVFRWSGPMGLDRATLRNRCAAFLMREKCPQRFFVVKELPETSSGKIARRAIRDAVQAKDPAYQEIF